MLAKAKEERPRGAFEASYDLVKAEVTLKLPRCVFSLGETIEGVVLVKPSKSFRVDELKVDALHHAEIIPEAILKQPILSFTDFRGSDVTAFPPTILERGVEFIEGIESEFPFRYKIPSVQRPSCKTKYYKANWFLRVISKRKHRPDEKASFRIVVANELN